MRIHSDFPGGNIVIEGQYEGVVTLERELRDTIDQNWFYWAFCIEGAEGQTLTFRFRENRIGYFGPAVSHDLKAWHWLDEMPEKGSCEYRDGKDMKFTYTFSADETKVYFAHHMLYPVERMKEFCEKQAIPYETLCLSRRGREVPCFRVGEGEKKIVVTAGHHACESTGMYVLEGFVESFVKEPIPGYEVFCVPFVDYDGVLDGDQGKERYPHDHNRDYDPAETPVWPETAALRTYGEKNQVLFGFDFHSPWHISGQNDWVFIPRASLKEDQMIRIGEELEKVTKAHPEAMRYLQCQDYPAGEGWNTGKAPTFGAFFKNFPHNVVAFSFETTYFGESDNRISQDRMKNLGKCFFEAFRNYLGN